LKILRPDSTMAVILAQFCPSMRHMPTITVKRPNIIEITSTPAFEPVVKTPPIVLLRPDIINNIPIIMTPVGISLAIDHHEGEM